MSMEVLNADDIASMDLDELKRTSRDIEAEPDEITFSPMAHHMTVRGKLEALVDKDVIDYDEMQEIYNGWKESKQ